MNSEKGNHEIETFIDKVDKGDIIFEGSKPIEQNKICKHCGKRHCGWCCVTEEQIMRWERDTTAYLIAKSRQERNKI